MKTAAIVLREPEQLALSQLELEAMTDDDVVIDVEWSGISTGTERLLWSGAMPPFPGLGYPLVPGYESVGRVSKAGARVDLKLGQRVFVPGARCFKSVRSLFGASAANLVVSAQRVVPITENLAERGVLLALAATAYHALAAPGAVKPERIVGHGVLGRLLARLTLAMGGDAPVVWERDARRRSGAVDYCVVDPSEDDHRACRAIYDVSGDPTILDALIARLAPSGEIVLAGFYSQPLSFSFPPAFMREARLRVAAEWKPEDLTAVKALIESGALSLDGLITHQHDAKRAPAAYRTAFEDPHCLKMLLDWSACS